LKKIIQKENHFSRRDFWAALAAAPWIVSKVTFAAELAKGDVKIASPNGRLQFQLKSSTRLNYRIDFRNKPVIETAQIGIIVDGVDLGESAEVGKIERYRLSEKYLWRGVHSEAINRCNGAKISVKHRETDFTIEVRAFNDGVAFRYLVPGNGKERVPDEATSFVMPEKSTLWYHDFYGHYEGVHVKKDIAEVKAGEWAAVPLTIKLPDGNGYASLTEAALTDYAGMGFQAAGRRGFKVVLGHALPVSHPFELRYSKEDIQRLSVPAKISGTIMPPWRVVMIGADLNALVNCDIVQNVSPPPDKNLFPKGFKTDWLRPGRAVWKYLDGGENTLESMKEFSRLAGQLGFEHNIVEGFWHSWSEAEMRELVDYSNQFKVGIWFWEHSKNLRTEDARQKFFDQLRRVGVIGAKIDFFDHEAKEIIDRYQALLRESAKHKIMVEFHGSNKPAGESRTFPNEMTRESIKGMEYRSLTERARHNTTLPFTRFLAGHADYTPLHFGERRRETSWAHQIASAAVFTSPVMVYAAHPKNILENPAVDLIKSIPSVWDETIVLPVSEIGEIAAFARRRGEVWFLAIMNGAEAKNVQIPLSFLSSGKHQTMLIRDVSDKADAVKIENTIQRKGDSLAIEMRGGGGFIARFNQSLSANNRRSAK
jgi:alpha-glucosidase